MIILFRTCGGLGNQLYQYMFCILVASRFNTYKIKHLHSTNYERYNEWVIPIQLDKLSNIIHKLIIKIRIPILFKKFGLNKNGFIKLFNIILIDGYFQDIHFYKQFNKIEIRNAIDNIKNIILLKNSSITKKDIIYHFRLGDIFTNPQEEMRFIIKNINNVVLNSTIISNKDDLFNESEELIKALESRNCQYLNTTDLTVIKLFNIFYHSSVIYSNGSSLSYFAATLSNSTILPISKYNNKYQQDSINRLEDLKKFINN